MSDPPDLFVVSGKEGPPPFYVLIKAFLQNMGLLPAHDRRLRLNPIS